MNTALEIKFSCPICHQHIKCDAEASGQIMSCPTCFRNIIVPQAPTGQTTRLILRAKQAPVVKAASSAGRQPATVRKTIGLAAAAAAVVAAMLFVVHQVKNLKLAHRQPVAGEGRYNETQN